MVQRESFIRGFSMALGVTVLAILLFFGWQLLQAVMAIATPFVAAIIVSLLLDPLVVRLQQRFTSHNRNVAVGLVFVLFLVVFLSLIAFLVPSLVGQTTRLVGFFTPTAYVIEKARAEDNNYEVVARDVTANSYTVVGLTNERPYKFRVTGVSTQGEPHRLPPVTATPDLDPRDEPIVVPTAPTPTPAPPSPLAPGGITSPAPTPTPAATPGTTPTPAPSVPDETLRALKAGGILAIPSNGAVELVWKPPTKLQSGFEQLQAKADEWLRSNKTLFGIKLPPNLEALRNQYSSQISRAVQETITRLGNFLLGSVSQLLTVVLVPIVTLYILLDMPRLRARFLYLLPEGPRRHFLRVAGDVGGAFSGYLSGMLTLSSLYGLGATIAYFACGLEGYALLLGFVAGLFYAVPFVGPAITMFLVGVVSLATGHSVAQTAFAIGATFALNMLFDNVLTPRIVGSKVGLHPITTMFSLFLGGQLFGFFGMIIAVPLAASVQASLVRIFPRLAEPVPLSVLMVQEEDRNRREGKRSADGDAPPADPPPGPNEEGTQEPVPTTVPENGNAPATYTMDVDEPLGEPKPVPEEPRPTAEAGTVGETTAKTTKPEA